MITSYFYCKKLVVTLFTSTLLFISFYPFAQTGSLDTRFGQQGKVITYFNGVFVDMRASTLQPDGKILCVGGYTTTEPSGGFIIVRYLQDGEIDSSFGDNGKVFTDFGYDYELATGIALSSDNKIIVGGYGSIGFLNIKYDVLVSKYKMNGSLDSTFGNNGKTIKSFGYDENIYSTIIQDDDKIVLSGNTTSDLLVSRFNSNGEADLSFGVNGAVTTDFFDREFGRSSAIQKDGKILLAGFKNLSHPQFIMDRYLSNGQLDLSFGNQGKVVRDIPGGDERIYSIGLQRDGKIIVGGVSGVTLSASNENITLLRYNIDGTLDASFGESGMIITSFEGVNTRVQSILISPDNKITIVGTSYEKDSYGALDFVLARYSENGNIDSSFGIDGKVISDFGGFETNATGLLQPDGKTVVTGMTTNLIETEYKLALARYNGDDPDRNKYVRIKHWLHHHGITWEDKPNNLINYYSIQSSTNGNAFTEVARIFSNHYGGIQTYTAANNATANYRVAAVSNTGNITYSNTLTLTATPTIILYPNPAKNNLQIQGLPAGITKLTVTDLSGNTSIIATTNSTVYSINIAQLTSGNYLLHIKTANEVITKQFIKE